MAGISILVFAQCYVFKVALDLKRKILLWKHTKSLRNNILFKIDLSTTKDLPITE